MREPLRERGFAVAVLAGIAALAATTVVVLAYGTVPEPPSLHEAPNPAIGGRLLYARSDGCWVSFEPATGAESIVSCFPGFGGPAVWLDESAVAIAQPGSGGLEWQVLRLDEPAQPLIETDVPVSSRALSPTNQRLPTGEIVTVDSEGRVRLVDPRSGETVRTIYDGGRAATVVGWSPDGQWLLLTVWRESKGRQELWVVSREGTDIAVVATDVMGGLVSWWQEGVGVFPDVPERDQLLEIAHRR